jgi:dipeptidyl aminopeptidase/acylaminoacyl peptidase
MTPPTRTARPTRARRRSARKPITPEDLLGMRLVAEPRVTPDGSQVVFVRKHVGEKNEYVSNLWMAGTDGEEPRQFTAGGKDTHPRFAPDGSRLAFVRPDREKRPQIHLMPVDGGEAIALTSFPEGSIAGFSWSPDGETLAVSFRPEDDQWTTEARKQRADDGTSTPPRVVDDMWYRLDGDGYFLQRRFALYLVDVDSGEHHRVFDKDTLGFFTYDFSPDGRQLVIAANRHRRALLHPECDELLLLNVARGTVRPVPGMPDGPKTLPRFSPDGRWIAYAGRIGGTDGIYSTENTELFVCDPRRGRPRSLTGKEDFCLMAAAVCDTAEISFEPCYCWHPDSKRLLMRIGHQGQVHIGSVKARGGPIQLLTRGAIDQDLGNVSDDGRWLALIRSTTTTMPEVHVGRLDGGELEVQRITDFNVPWLRQRSVSRPTAHWVRTADGTRVQVWWIKPTGGSARRRRPALLEIHGGPHAQYGSGFFHEFQALASAGYHVFYANPRGSKGYGRDHCAAIRGAWGSADWVDIQAVTAFMKQQAGVDPKRLGILGGSYGGYMTNWAIGRCRDFAAAVTDRCVSNLVSMGGSSDFMEPPDQYFPGNSWDRTEARWAQSPMRHLGNVRTPTLIIHSEGDLRCNVEQAEQVFAALKIRNIPTRFVRYPSTTSHGMSRGGPPDLRVHRLQQIMGWFERYLK